MTYKVKLELPNGEDLRTIEYITSPAINTAVFSFIDGGIQALSGKRTEECLQMLRAFWVAVEDAMMTHWICGEPINTDHVPSDDWCRLNSALIFAGRLQSLLETYPTCIVRISI